MGAETLVSLRDHTIGAGPVVWLGAEHLQPGPPDVRSAEEHMPVRDGVTFAGSDRLGGRDLLVPVVFNTVGAGAGASTEQEAKHLRVAAMIDALGQLTQAWRPASSDLLLNVVVGGARTFVAYGRPRPFTPGSLHMLHKGDMAGVLRFRMSRPYVYDVAPVATTVTLDQGSGGVEGLGYPHGYPHGYGTQGVSSSTHTAGGRLNTWPVVVLRAGADDTLRDPVLVRDDTGQQLGLVAGTTVTQGTQLVVDMYLQRVYETQLDANVMGANPASLALVDRSTTVDHPTKADWWDLPPEPTSVRLLGLGQGTATVLTRAAYYL